MEIEATYSELDVVSVVSADMATTMIANNEPFLLDRCDSMPATAQPLHLAMAEESERQRRHERRRLRAQEGQMNLRKLR
jgi:hypothetical protein